MVRIDFKYLDPPSEVCFQACTCEGGSLMNLTTVWRLHARSDDVVSRFSGDNNCNFG